MTEAAAKQLRETIMGDPNLGIHVTRRIGTEVTMSHKKTGYAITPLQARAFRALANSVARRHELVARTVLEGKAIRARFEKK